MEKQVIFDATAIDLFIDIQRIQKEYGLKRANSIILLKVLLEEKNSIFYECLCATSIVAGNPYKQIISDCDRKLEIISKNEEEISSEEKPFEIFMSNQEEKTEIYMTDNFFRILKNTFDMAAEEQEEPEKLSEVSSTYFFVALLNIVPKDVLNILKDNGVFIEAIKEHYDFLVDTAFISEVEDDEEGEEELPAELSDFATIISNKYKGVKECEILGRDKECSKIMRILQKRGKKNAILIGEPGVGKTAIVEKIAYDIANGNCPETFKDYIVIQVDVNNSIAGTKLRGMAEERFKLLIDYLNSHDNVILFIDEIHMVIGAGSTSGDESNNMANALKPFLASKNAKVIGATTEKEYQKYFSQDQAFNRRFEKVLVKEPKSKQVVDMLKNSIKAHEEFHGVKIEEDMVEYAVLISSCFNKNTHNPDRTNDLIDCAMVIAKEQGKQYVDSKCVLENFNINFEKFEKLEKSEKLATSYHESGHYLGWRKSGRLKNWKGIAISIMPADDYLGVTVFDELDEEITVYPDKNYYIDFIAHLLAGRVAEAKYTNNISAGACADLEEATKMAYRVVVEYGMSDNFGNRIFLEDENYHMVSESVRNEVNKEVREIIETATKRAEEIITENSELLKKLVDALMEKGILDENDLEEICKEYD